MKKKKETLEAEKLDGLILTRKLTAGERAKASEELRKARLKSQAAMTSQDRLAAKILQFKLKLNDYLKKDEFDPRMVFASWLVEYVGILEIKRRAFAREIDITEAELSHFINQRRTPAESLFIRLEIHSNHSIPANWWLKLIEKERGHHISTDKKLRNKEEKHVFKKLEVSV